MDLVVDPYTLARENKLRLVMQMHGDIGVGHAASFVASSNSGAQ
jgi:hypothetical protein